MGVKTRSCKHMVSDLWHIGRFRAVVLHQPVFDTVFDYCFFLGYRKCLDEHNSKHSGQANDRKENI